MELIVIDEHKLKIMLTPPDMRHYDLRAERMSAANAATRRAFRHIFDDARDRIGFDTSGERLLVQLYTSRGGGCEIFVTKLGAEEISLLSETDAADSVAEDALLARLAKEDAMTTIPAVAPNARSFRELPSEPTAYRFQDAEHLFALCRRLSATGFAGQSRVYIDEEGKIGTWYLFLTPADGTLPAFVREYATAEAVCEPDSLMLYLSEHGRCLCETGAVELLGRA